MAQGSPAKRENFPDSPLGQMYAQHIHFTCDHSVEGLPGQYTDACLLISAMTPDMGTAGSPISSRFRNGGR